MLKIYICENNNKQRCTLEKIINNIIAFENHNMEIILSTSNPYELLDTIENKDYTLEKDQSKTIQQPCF